MLKIMALFGLVVAGLTVGEVMAADTPKDEKKDEQQAKPPEWQEIHEEDAEEETGVMTTGKAGEGTADGWGRGAEAVNTYGLPTDGQPNVLPDDFQTHAANAEVNSGGVFSNGADESYSSDGRSIGGNNQADVAAEPVAAPKDNYSYNGADLGLSPKADAAVAAHAEEIRVQQEAADAERARLNVWADSRTPESERTLGGQIKNMQYAEMEAKDEAVDRSITEAARQGHMDIYSSAAMSFKPLTSEQQEKLAPEEKIQYQADARMAGAYEGYIARNSGYVSEDIAARMQDPIFKDGYDSSMKLPSDDGEGGHRGQYPITEPINTGRSQADIKNTGGIGNVPGAMPGGKEDAAITSNFGERNISWSPFHYARDVRAEVGEEVKPSADGVVKAVNYEAPGRVSVVVDHGNGFSSVFRHIQAGSTPSIGTQVDGDETSIGRVATAGTGPHIHYEVWDNGKVVNLNNYDPAAYADRCTAYCDNATMVVSNAAAPETTASVNTGATAAADVWGDPNVTRLPSDIAAPQATATAASSVETAAALPPPAEQARADAQTTLGPTATQRLENGEWPRTKAERVALTTQYLREQGYDERVVKETVATINRENGKWDIYDKNPTSSAYGLGQYITSTWNGAVVKQQDYDGSNWRSDPQAQLDVLADDVQRRYDAYNDGTIKGCSGVDFGTCNYIYHYVGSSYNPNRPGDRQYAINYTARTQGDGYAWYDRAVATLGDNPTAAVASMQTVQTAGLTSGRDPWGAQVAGINNMNAAVMGSAGSWTTQQPLQTVMLPDGQRYAVVDRGNGVTNLYNPYATSAYAQPVNGYGYGAAPQWAGGSGAGVGVYPQTANYGGGYGYAYPAAYPAAVGSVPATLAGQPVVTSRVGQPVTAAGAQPASIPVYHKGEPVRGIHLAGLGLRNVNDIKAFCKHPESSLYKQNKDLAIAVCGQG